MNKPRKCPVCGKKQLRIVDGEEKCGNTNCKYIHSEKRNSNIAFFQKASDIE